MPLSKLSKKSSRRASEDDVLRHSMAHPEQGQARVADELARRGLIVSASGVRQIWLRHGLQTIYQRLKALEEKAGARTAALTAAQREIIRRGDRTRQAAQSAEYADAEPDRRTLILDAAAKLFSERGYEGASIRDLAMRVGLMPGSIYHYCRSKEALFIAVHREGFRELVAAVAAAVAAQRDPWARLAAAFEVHITSLVAGSPAVTMTGVSMFSIRDKRLSRKLKADRDRYEALFGEVVAALPLSPGVDRKMFRFMALGALNWTLVWYRAGELTPRQIAAHFVAVLRQGAG